MPDERLIIASLQNPDEVSGFCCRDGSGAADPEEFIRSDAFEYERRNLSRTYLGWSDNRLVGFFSLGCGSVRFEKEGDEAKAEAGLGDIRFVIPAVLLARLAVDDRYRQLGFGKQLFQYAVRFAQDYVAEYAGCRLMVVDAYLVRQTWYEARGCNVIAKARHTGSGVGVIRMCLDLSPPRDRPLPFG